MSTFVAATHNSVIIGEPLHPEPEYLTVCSLFIRVAMSAYPVWYKYIFSQKFLGKAEPQRDIKSNIYISTKSADLDLHTKKRV